MTRSESEHQSAIARLDAARERLAQHKEAWRRQGFTSEQIEKLAEPLESFYMQCEERARASGR